MGTAVRMRRPSSPTLGNADWDGGCVRVEWAQDGRGRADHSEDPHHRREWGGQVQVRRCAAGLRPPGCGLLSGTVAAALLASPRPGPVPGSGLTGRVPHSSAAGLGSDPAETIRTPPAY